MYQDKVKVQPVTSRVMQAIRDTILTNDLKAGDPLPPEGVIATQLGVSRASVREAVRSLAALGVVEVKHGQGVFVKGFDFGALVDSLSYSLSVKDLHIGDLLEIREGLEILFVPKVVARITAEDIDRLEAIAQRIKDKTDRGEAFPEEDQEFHLALYRPVGNDLLLRMINLFWLSMDRLISLTHGGWEIEPGNSYHDHIEILEALKRGDTALMQERILIHYLPMKQQLLRKGLSKETFALEQALESKTDRALVSGDGNS